ncbi:hypothetical protein PBRA_002468 [Plasmodiophora brassicae]|uniref:Uncharacterized protein n=1 Tax=Plasmodiophora brassicae TaxID=37360 RepID=A0A0G4J3K7_PLABS|nr:hypothetical protein PBRA_002468 [Plasmodiophora brassicae]
MSGVLAIVATDDTVTEKVTIPVLPHELVHLQGRELVAIIKKHKDRLLASWAEDDVTKIVSQHKALKAQYDSSARMRTALSRCNDQTTFDDAWAIEGIRDRYGDLCRFVGGLASILPNTATVEADFSSLKFEKDKFSKSLTDFSLETKLQARRPSWVVSDHN